MAATQTTTKPGTKPRDDTGQPRRWNVVLLDDDHHTYEYVIRMMQELFAHTKERAFELADKVNSDGRAICLTTHKEHAELKREQIHAYGRDPLMVESQGSMSAIIEPADFGEDDKGGEGGKGGGDKGGADKGKKD